MGNHFGNLGVTTREITTPKAGEWNREKVKMYGKMMGPLTGLLSRNVDTVGPPTRILLAGADVGIRAFRNI